MSDELTRRLKREYANRTKTYMDSIRRSAPSVATTPTGTPPQPTSVLDAPSQGEDMFSTWSKSQYPDWYDSSDTGGWSDASFLNAAGATLWSFADTATFSTLGYATKALGFDASDIIDFEDPAAKWGGGLGGFAGFIYGAPMKIMAKGAQKLLTKTAAKSILKGTGKQTADDAVRLASEVGKKAGLSKKAIKELMGGYKNLVKEASINPKLWGQEFAKATDNYLNAYIAKGLGKEISNAEAQIIRKMFSSTNLMGKNARPIQDLTGALVKRFGDTRMNRWIGHAAKDIVTFGMIDATFEGVRTAGENILGNNYTYQISAPLWGMANGLAFSSLAWMSPKGKSAKWSKDFKAGLSRAFKVNPYKKMNKDQLVTSAAFWGKTLTDSGKSSMVKMKGKSINLTAKTLHEDLEHKFGDATEEVLRKSLSKLVRKEGRSMMWGITAEDAKNLYKVWPRMAAGGMLFNAHSFYDMYFNEAKFDIHDILPHFLIGAWVQRKSNPASVDLNSRSMNQLRKNMYTLGVSPGKMSAVPTFKGSENRLRNLYNESKWQENEDLAKQLGIIGRNLEDVSVPLKPGESSVEGARDPVFDILYQQLEKRGEYIKLKGDISREDASRLVEHALKVEPDLADPFKRDSIIGESFMKTTESFEDTFSDILKEVEEIDVNNETGIRTVVKEGSPEVPVFVDFSSLMGRAEKGELLWLKGEKGSKNENAVLTGEEATRALADMQDSFNSILSAARSMDKAQLIADTKERSKEVTDENLANNIYQTVRMNERRINEKFPDKSSTADDFSYAKDRDDYLTMLIHNYSIKIAKKTLDVFNVEGEARDSQLASLLSEAGILLPGVTKEGKTSIKIIDKTDNLTIKGIDKDDPNRKDKIAEAKIFLGRVLTLQSIAGRNLYEGHKLNQGEHFVEIGDVDQLRKYLKSKKINLDEISDSHMENLTDFALRRAIKDSDLTIGQANALFNLTVHGVSRFSTKSEGEAGGFRVTRINEGLSKSPEVAAKINQRLQEMINDSKGLVQWEGELRVMDLSELYAIRDTIDSSQGTFNAGSIARAEVLGVLQALHASDKPYASFTEHMRGFISANNINAETMEIWLIQAGVITKGESGKKSKIDIDKLSEVVPGKELNGEGLQLWKDLSRRMENTGWTADFVEAKYTEYEDKARENLLKDTDESRFEAGITINEFFKNYRLDDPSINYSLESPEVQKMKMEELIFEVKGDKVLKLDVFEKLLDRIYVREGSDWVKFNRTGVNQELINNGEVRILNPERSRDVRFKTLEKMAGLFQQQKAQVRIQRLKYTNGEVIEDTETRLFSKMYNYLKYDLDIPYYVVDGRSSVYEMSADGRYVNKQSVDIFGETTNLSKASNDHIRERRLNFERDLELHMAEMQPSDGTRGLVLMQLFPNMEPIAIQKQHLPNMRQQFLSFFETYHNHPDMTEPMNRQLRSIRDRVNESLNDDIKRPISPDKYNHMLSMLVSEQMLSGSDGNKLFIKYLNSDTNVNVPKLMSYVKLFNSKQFVFTDNDFVVELSEVYRQNGELKVGGKDGVLRKFARKRNGKGGFDGVIWNDVDFANLKVETARQLEELGITAEEWSWDHSIGSAHQKATSYDSITKVSRDMMMFAHAVVGHDPYSFTPIKPIFNSNGLSPLLLGKTLLEYDSSLDGFFKKNKDIDFIIARSGAKAYNSLEGEGVNDLSLVNKADFELNDHTVEPQQIRSIPLEALGLKIEKDYYQHTAKEAVADQNYANNEESTRWYNEQYREQLNSNLESIKTIMDDPISLRKWMLSEMEGDHNLSSSLVESESLSHLNNMFFWSSISRDANPMSYSDSIVKNKMYQIYVDKLLNSSRSITNQYNEIGSDRYGGQGILIQSVSNRLKGTFVNANGDMLSRGEVMIPHHEKNSSILNFMKDGIGLRFVISGKKLDETSKGSEVFTGEQVFGKEYWDWLMETAANRAVGGGGVTLLELHNAVKEFASEKPEWEGLSIAITTRRNPRTRPNDMSILGLKGFLKSTHGNALAINSLDVANIYEGDYDVDKADYWFSHRDTFWRHVERASQFYVQGVDPTDLMKSEDFRWSAESNKVVQSKNQISANLNLYKSSIGRVQKIPRILGYLDKLGYESTVGNEFIEGYNSSFKNTKIMDGAKILLGGNSGTKDGKPWADNYMITFDYNNLDYFLRAALETQYIIDGKGDINSNIARNMETWSDDFLFPKLNLSVSPGQVKEGGASFINDIRNTGESGGKRVRIFRRLERTADGYKEVELTALDKAIIKEMMQEYSNLLKVSRDYMYEGTGEKARVSYEDIFDASEQFFLFNRDLNNSLYYRLRKKIADPTDPRKKKWADSEDFKERFGVVTRDYKKFKKKKYYNVSTKKAVYTSVDDNGRGFYNGERGAPLDRVYQRLYESDPFTRSRLREATGDIVGLMNNWYNELLGGADSGDVSRMSDRLNATLSTGALKYNQKIEVIGSMKKKIMQILSNTKIPYKTRKESVDKLNTAVSKIEKEIATLIPKKYWRTKKRSDLEKIKFVDIDAPSMKQGMIHATTMNTIRNFLPGVEDSGQSFALKKNGIAYLNDIKSIRKAFYGNSTRLKDIYDYGAKTILTEKQIALLKNFPDLSTYYKIETQLLLDGYKDYGIQFIYNFMTLPENKYAMGVFNGKVQPVPYEATDTYNPSSRYRRGVRFLTSLAKGEFADKGIEMEKSGMARDGLYLFQFIEAQWDRFYNRNVHMKQLLQGTSPEGFLGDIKIEGQVPTALLMSAKANIYNHLKLPDVNKQVTKMFQSFRGIEWKTSSENRISHGRDLTNDHLFDFYNSIMSEVGKGKEFEEYRVKMNMIEQQMINNEIIDPIDYMALRSSMDKDVMNIASTVFTGGLTAKSGGTQFVRNITNNPVYILMGGEDYFKGYSFETAAKRNLLKRLERHHKMSKDFDNYREGVDVGTTRTKNELEELINECG